MSARSSRWRKASYAGDKKLTAKRRTFGVVHYDDDAGTFRQSVADFKDLLAGYRVKTATTVPYSLDLATAEEDAVFVVTKLQTSGVTTVLLAVDPVFPTFLTQEATNQGYFPEWVVLGYVFTDTAVFGRQYDQKQWAHAFGVSLLPTRTADDVDEFATILEWQTGKPPAAKTFRELVQAPLIFFTGVHLAGPRLTARTFRAGVDRFPADAAHGAHPPASLVGSPPHLEGPRRDGQRRRHRRVVGPGREGPRRSRTRRYRSLPVRRRGRALLTRRMAEATGRSVRRRHVGDGAHKAATRRRAPTYPAP